MNRYFKTALLTGTSLLVAACSSEEPAVQAEAPQQVEEEQGPIERRNGYVTGAATFAFLKIYEPGLTRKTKFEFMLDTIDQDDCLKVFENKRPWTDYCHTAQQQKAPVSFSDTFEQIPAGGEEAYAGDLLTPESGTQKFQHIIIPSMTGTLVMRVASEPNIAITFDDLTVRFDSSEQKVAAAKNAIAARRSGN